MKLTNYEGEYNLGKNITEAGVLLMAANFLCATGVWQSILQGWKVAGEGELFFQAFIRAGESFSFAAFDRNTCYVYFLSTLFAFLGNREEMVLVINLLLQTGGVALFYRGTRAFFGVAPSLVAAVGMAIGSCCFYPVVRDTSMHLLWLLTAFLFWMIMKHGDAYRKNFKPKKMFFILPVSILTGMLLYVDYIGLGLLFILLTVPVLNGKLKKKDKLISFLLALALAAGSWFGMVMLEGSKKEKGVFVAFLEWFQTRTAVFSEPEALTQYGVIAAFLVFFCILFIWHVSKDRKKVEDVSDQALVKMFTEEEIRENTREEVLHKPIEAKHRNKKKVQNGADEIQEASQGKASKAKKRLLAEISKEKKEGKKTAKLLENPLPGPKKHVKKEMNYAFEPAKEQMHYDLNNYNVNDDYDLK